MLCLERWFGYALVLVVYLAVHQCVFIQSRNKVVQKEWQNSSDLPPANITCNNFLQTRGFKNNTDEALSCTQNVTTVPSAASPIAPPVFPREAINGTIIINCKTTANQTICLNTTEVNPNITKTATNDEVQLDNTINLNTTVTSNNGTNETIPQYTTDLKLTSNEVGTTVNLNETNVNKNETEIVSRPINATVQANATASETNSSKIDTEVRDLLTPDCIQSSRNQSPKSPPVPVIIYNASQSVDKETELIEDGENTEDILRNSSAIEGKPPLPGVPLVQGQLAAILAGVFVAISVIAYLGLLSWRRYLENRYGNRQMLVNEDEFNDDLRHFSI